MRDLLPKEIVKPLNGEKSISLLDLLETTSSIEAPLYLLVHLEPKQQTSTPLR